MLAIRQGEIDVWATQNAKLVQDLRREGVVQIIGGTGEGETNLIEQYAGTTQIATVRTEWATAPERQPTITLSPSTSNSSPSLT